MASDEVKLLGAWPNPFLLRVRIALSIKSVSYEYEEENVIVSKSEILLKSNPGYKKIRVLIHGGKPVCESPVIVEYVDDVWASGPAINPADPYDWVVARFRATYIDSKEEAKKAAIEEVTQGLAWLEDAFIKCSKGQDFFGGETIGYLDIALGCFLPWVRVIQTRENISWIDEAKTPNLFKWSQNFSADAAVKDDLPQNEKMEGFAEFIVAKLKG